MFLLTLKSQTSAVSITPSRSWDFRDCSSTTIMDSITNLWATMQGTAVCTTDGVLMDGNEATYIEVESFSWDGSSGVSFEVFGLHTIDSSTHIICL